MLNKNILYKTAKIMAELIYFETVEIKLLLLLSLLNIT